MSESNSDNKTSPGIENGQGAPSQNPPEMEELRAQIEKYKNDYLYLRAEFDNYKRNVIKERADLLKYGSERLINEILGVLDNFERALEIKATPENLSTYTKGIEMTQQELKSALQKFGVAEIPSLGLPFDPSIHEALSSEETDAVKPGSVSRVFKKPYKLHDKVIRPGQVIVAKEPVTN
ncbi:MAG: nucleotide exchange factor GrpE [Pseudobdellovibrionaceae bacterium]